MWLLSSSRNASVIFVLHCNTAAAVAPQILPPKEQCAGIDHGHWHCRGHRTPHCCRCRRYHHDAPCHQGNQVEEDPIRQAEEGVFQAVLEVGTISSIVILLLWRRESLLGLRLSGSLRLTAGAAMPPEHPPRRQTLPVCGVHGDSCTDRGNDNHNADVNHCCRPRPHPLRAVMAVVMMTIAGERGGEAMARRLQGNNEASEMQWGSA